MTTPADGHAHPRENDRFSYRANGFWWEDLHRPEAEGTERYIVSAFEAEDGRVLIAKWNRPEAGFKGRGTK